MCLIPIVESPKTDQSGQEDPALVWEQFNFQWTKKMREEAQASAKAEGIRGLSAYVRAAVAEKIKRSKGQSSAE